LQTASLKKETQGLHKILVQELGEGYSVEKLLKNEASFKGRAEQIFILKEKIKELTRKYQLTRQKDNGCGFISAKPLTAQSIMLKKVENELSVQFAKAQEEVLEYKRRSDGLTARIKYL
jgi:hypothetical protein